MGFLRYRIRRGQPVKPRIPESETGTDTDTVGSVLSVNEMYVAVQVALDPQLTADPTQLIEILL